MIEEIDQDTNIAFNLCCWLGDVKIPFTCSKSDSFHTKHIEISMHLTH